MKILAWLFVLVFLSGCPESIAQQCPPRTVAVGQFSIALTGQLDAGTACVRFDGGGTDPMTLVDGGAIAGALCYGASTGTTQQLYFVAPGKGARPSALGADGGFHFTGHADPTTGVCAGCAVIIDDVLDGYLQSGAAGTPFVLQPDGGLPPVTGLTGTFVDFVYDGGVVNSPDGGCQCNVPCTVTYSAAGSPF